MRLRKPLIWIVVVAVLAGIAAYLLRGEEPALPAYSVAKVSRGDLVATVSATGTLSPLIEVLVGSQVSGTIASLSADFNSPVKQGDAIAQIDPALFRARVAEAEANLQRAEAERDKAQVAVLDARRQLNRVLGLQKRNLVSDSDVDAARFAVQSAEVQHRVTEAQVAQNAAALNYAQLNLDYTTIHAPIDGVVISRDVDVGQTVAASLQAPTLFTIARDLAQMQIETDVDEAYIGQVREGQPVTFTVFAYPGREFRGSVAQVRLQPKIEAGVVKYNCIIHVDNADLALKPGMTATVSIEVARHEGVLKVSNNALRFVPALPAERLKKIQRELKPGYGLVWTTADGALRPIQVELGVVGETDTEVSGEGLKEDLPIAVPLGKERTPRRPRGFSLF